VSSTAAWYSFDDPPIVVDAKAEIKGMRFVVDGKLHDQGGVGFAVQDTVMFSETSCLTDPDASPVKWRFDVVSDSRAVGPQRSERNLRLPRTRG
jgi:hypothetical protein